MTEPQNNTLTEQQKNIRTERQSNYHNPLICDLRALEKSLIGQNYFKISYSGSVLITLWQASLAEHLKQIVHSLMRVHVLLKCKLKVTASTLATLCNTFIAS